MANIALAWNNLAAASTATLTASASVTLAPVSRLLNKHVARKWRANGTSAAVICDLTNSGAFTVSVDTVALIGMSGDNPDLRVKISSSDTSGVAGDVYDSGALTGAWDSDYLSFVHLISTPKNARIVRIDISEAGVSYIEAGVLFIGLRSQLSTNFAPGWQRAWVDPTKRTVGRSGQSFDDLRDKYRTLNLTLEWLTLTERNSITEAIDIALGQSGDMLVITDPDSSNLSRDCIWGYNETINPVIEPIALNESPWFSRTYNIRERL